MEREITEAIQRYASGAFPMDDEDAQDAPLPWYTAPERAVFPLDEGFRDELRRRLRRDLRRCTDHALTVDADYDAVLELCAEPPEGDGVWITPRLAALYRRLHAAGVAHSFELRDARGELSAGILGVVIGRAAMLESMRRTQPSAGKRPAEPHARPAGRPRCDALRHPAPDRPHRAPRVRAALTQRVPAQAPRGAHPWAGRMSRYDRRPRRDWNAAPRRGGAGQIGSVRLIGFIVVLAGSFLLLNRDGDKQPVPPSTPRVAVDAAIRTPHAGRDRQRDAHHRPLDRARHTDPDGLVVDLALLERDAAQTLIDAELCSDAAVFASRGRTAYVACDLNAQGSSRQLASEVREALASLRGRDALIGAGLDVPQSTGAASAPDASPATTTP